MSVGNDGAAAFSGLIDLASERFGGEALYATDEFFAGKENLLKPGRGVFIADKYTDRGKWMDGWESRRKRGPGYDYCVLKLGVRGIVAGFDIDTNFFLGNHPPFASVDACRAPSDGDFDWKKAEWTEILPKSPLKAGSQNLFPAILSGEWTHVRLNIYPDGGVARFRVYGEPATDFGAADFVDSRGVKLYDLASMLRGGRAVACSDMFFSSMQNLIMPGDSADMGDGWETKRRRGPGFDWVIVKLGHPGILRRLDLYTTHFKGNFPDRASLEGAWAPGADIDVLNAHLHEWKLLLAESKLAADSRHSYGSELLSVGPVSHLRLNIYPDGGIARMRAYCELEGGIEV